MSHGSAFARAENLGAVVKVEWNSIRRSTDHASISLLAHEFAHVYQFAVRKTRDQLTTDDFQGAIIDPGLVGRMGPEGKVELHADETMDRWGFDYLGWLQWLHQNVEIDRDHGWKEDQDRNLVLRRKPLLERTARRRAFLGKQAVYFSDMSFSK